LLPGVHAFSKFASHPLKLRNRARSFPSIKPLSAHLAELLPALLLLLPSRLLSHECIRPLFFAPLQRLIDIAPRRTNPGVPEISAALRSNILAQGKPRE
jgi:hypothetical protein